MNFLEQLRQRLQERIDARATAVAEMNTLLETPAAENRDLNDTEQASFLEVRNRIARFDLTDPNADGYDESIHALRTRVDELAAIEQRNRDIAAIVPPAAVGGAIVRRDGNRVYRQYGPNSFLADLFSHQVTRIDPSASQRLAQHMNEVRVDLAERRDMPAEYRDLVISAVAGLVPPQYLVDEFAPIARAGRPFLNMLNGRPLPPDGVTFTIPRGTTGTLAAMTAEGSGWSEQDYAATDLTSTVNLVTAQQDLSRTTFMRGGQIVDDVLFPDLLSDAEVKLNLSALNGNGTAPNHRGVLQVAGISVVTYTDATPTVGELWPKFSDAIQRINTLRYTTASLVIVMHPRRWGMITSAVDTTGRPLFPFTVGAPPNLVVGLGEATKYGQVVGTLQGVPVVTDASIPTNLGAGTNEDIILVVNVNDVRYWEDDILQFTFEQTLGPAQVRLAVGRFSLFVPGRYPTGIATIGGTGLTPPTF